MKKLLLSLSLSFLWCAFATPVSSAETHTSGCPTENREVSINGVKYEIEYASEFNSWDDFEAKWLPSDKSWIGREDFHLETKEAISEIVSDKMANYTANDTYNVIWNPKNAYKVEDGYATVTTVVTRTENE